MRLSVWRSLREGATITLMGASILIVDDHSGFRACARRALEREGYDVVAEAADGAEGLARARELRPRLRSARRCDADHKNTNPSQGFHGETFIAPAQVAAGR